MENIFVESCRVWISIQHAEGIPWPGSADPGYPQGILGTTRVTAPRYSSRLSQVTLVTLFYLRLVPHTHFACAYALVSCASGSLLLVLQADDARLRH